MQYVCSTCGERHEGVPGLSADAPLYYYTGPQPERATRCRLGTDTCVVDEGFFFARACLEVPIFGEPKPFIWVSGCLRAADRHPAIRTGYSDVPSALEEAAGADRAPLIHAGDERSELPA